MEWYYWLLVWYSIGILFTIWEICNGWDKILVRDIIPLLLCPIIAPIFTPIGIALVYKRVVKDTWHSFINYVIWERRL